MEYYNTVDEARFALQQKFRCCYDPFEPEDEADPVLIDGPPTMARLAELGVAVDPRKYGLADKAAESPAWRAAQTQADLLRAVEIERQRYRDEAAARPSTQKYAAAAAIIGGGNSSMTEIGDDLAHVRNDRGVAVVERVDGKWVARLPKAGEKIYA